MLLLCWVPAIRPALFRAAVIVTNLDARPRSRTLEFRRDVARLQHGPALVSFCARWTRRDRGRGLDGPIDAYGDTHDLLAEPGTSGLSPYLRWG